jgi:hypothetical protein
MAAPVWLEVFKASIGPVLGTVTAVAIIIINNYLARNKAKSTMDHTMDKGAEIYKFIYGLRDRFSALRVSVYLLHNGGTYFNGDHKKKVTLQYEAPRPDEDEISDDFQDRLIKGAVFNWINAIRSNQTNCLYIENRALLHDLDIRGLMGAYGAESSFSLLVRDREGDAIAVLELAFDRTDALSSLDRDQILSQSARLRNLLLSKTITITPHGKQLQSR